jgi:hypothetical protein
VCSGNADLVEDRSRQVTGSVKILTHLVARVGPAVTKKAAAVREREHEAADFGGEWMMLSIASRVQPQDLPCRAHRRQRVQHGQNRRRPDSRAEQHRRPLSGLQNEASARRADLEGLAHPDMIPQVGLSDLEQRAADLITVADAHGIVGQSLDREVLAKLPVHEVGPLQLLLPIAIRFDLVDEDGSLLTPVPGQVALSVSV